MKHRTLNLRLLVISGIASLLLGGAVVIVHSLQISKTAQAMLVLAEREEQQLSWLKAADYLDRYLRLMPKDRLAQVRLAADYSKGAETIEQKLRAIELHYAALSFLTPDEALGLRVTLTELLLEVGRYFEAQNQAQQLATLNSNSPVASRLIALATFRQFQQGAHASVDFKKLGLLKMVEKGNVLNPKDVSLAIALATLYREYPQLVRAERPETTEEECLRLANDTLERLVQKNPASSQVYLTRFRYRTQYKLEGAQSDLEEAFRLAPNDIVVMRTVAFAALENAREWKRNEEAEKAQSHFTRAKEILQRIIDNNPKQATPEIYLALGDAHLGLGDSKLSFQCWQNGLKKFVQPTIRTQFLSRMADGYLEQKEFSLAQESLSAIDEILEDLGASVPRSESLAIMRRQRLRRATLLLRQEEIGKAIALLQQIVSQQTPADEDAELSARVWMLLGAAYSSMDEWKEAGQAFDRASVFKPGEVAARVAAANTWLNAGRYDLAADRARDVLQPGVSLKAGEGLEARLVLATSLFRLEIARPLKSREWTSFRKALADLESISSEGMLVQAPWRVDFLRAEYEFHQPKVKEDFERGRNSAGNILKLAEAKYAASAVFLGQLCLLFEQFDLSTEADRVLKRLRELKGSPLVAAVTSARLAVARRQYDVAMRELDQVEKHLSAAELRVLLDERVNIALAKRDLTLARALLLRQYERSPHDLTVIRRLADIDLERREMGLLEKWEQSLVQLGPLGQPLYLYYHSCRMLFSGTTERELRLREASDAQARLAVLRPDWSETYALRGMIEQQRGELEQAVSAYERAIELGEPRLYVFERLITLLEQLKRGDDAEKYVSRLQLQMPRSQRVTELTSAKQLRQFHPDHAIATARLAVEDRPDDASAHAWLGRMLMMGNKTSDSEKEFKKALELAPHDVSSWHGLFSFYIRLGAKDKAKAVLNSLAEKAQLSEVDRSFVLGQGYELLGDVETAVRYFREAAEAAPQHAGIQLRLAGILLRSDSREAESCLRKCIQLAPQDPAARRMLASLLASRGSDTDFQEAESLLKGFQPDDLVSVEDQRLRALLFAQKGGQNNIARAAELLEELLRSPNGISGDRLFLAQLYEFQSSTSVSGKTSSLKLEQAKKQLLDAASSAEADIRHFSAIIEFLSRNHQEQEIPKWLKKYEETLSAAPQDQAEPIAKLLLLKTRLAKGADCERWLARLEKVDRHPVRPLVLRAKVLIDQNQTKQGLQLILSEGERRLKATNEQREKSLICQGLGDFLFGLSDFPGAEHWYKHLVELEPTRFEYLTAALAKQNKLDEAIILCEASAETDKGSKPAIVLGNTIFETAWDKDHLGKADVFISSTLARLPTDPGLLYTTGLVRIVQGQNEEAIALFRKLLTIEPQNVAALNNLALLLSERPADRTEALTLIDRAINLSGGEPSLLDTKGTILVHNGQATKAITVMESAAFRRNADPRYRLHLAWAYRETGEIAKAKQELSQVLTLSQKANAPLLSVSDSRLLKDLTSTLKK
jgi:tetratricopeptide (TPR) repeat protein